MNKMFTKAGLALIGPWVISKVWPLIEEKLLKIFEDLLSKIIEWIKQYFTSTSEQRANDAEGNAAAAAKAADSATNTNQEEVLRAVAAVWRQVAEQSRQDLAAANQRIQDFERQGVSKAKERIEDLSPNLSFDSGAPVLELEGEKHDLPRLE